MSTDTTTRACVATPPKCRYSWAIYGQCKHWSVAGVHAQLTSLTVARLPRKRVRRCRFAPTNGHVGAGPETGTGLCGFSRARCVTPPGRNGNRGQLRPPPRQGVQPLCLNSVFKARSASAWRAPATHCWGVARPRFGRPPCRSRSTQRCPWMVALRECQITSPERCGFCSLWKHNHLRRSPDLLKWVKKHDPLARPGRLVTAPRTKNQGDEPTGPGKRVNTPVCCGEM